jgi:hypothetical protein
MDLKNKISKEAYLALKNQCKAYSEAGSALRKAAIKNKGWVRHSLRDMKRDNGRKARLYHLALCFLRGRKYLEIETENALGGYSAKDIHNFLQWKVSYTYRDQLAADIDKFFSRDEVKTEAA